MVTETRFEPPRTGTENGTPQFQPEYLQEYEIPGIVVIIPALEEAAGIFRTITELDMDLRPYTGKTYLVVDGNSTDGTGHIAHRLGAVVLEQEGIGKGDAIRQALGHVPENTKYVVLTDADFTYPAVTHLRDDPPHGIRLINWDGKREPIRK